MKIPHKILVGGHEFDVEMVGELLDNSGICNTWKQYIAINSYNTKEDKQSETFLHEILEAIKSIYNVNIDHQSLTTISEALFGVIRQNNLDFRK